VTVRDRQVGPVRGRLRRIDAVTSHHQSQNRFRSKGFYDRGNVAKFGQNGALRRFLLATGKQVLVEARPRDRIWGIGMGAKNEKATKPQLWRGQNLLGFALMQVRLALAAGDGRK